MYVRSWSLFFKKYLSYLEIIDRVFVRFFMGRILSLLMAFTSMLLWKQIQRLEHVIK
ncbi:MAG: hypothetical protein LBG98_00035 [Puniceicoccales bacterium]|jgi:hypothetical protein|nr:hypothetical protein [Puniceicoccales bacterium]